MTRLRWNERQSPTDLDDSPNTVPSYEFDYRRCNESGKPSWPERHGKERFGPSLIRKALASGLMVFAEIDGFPYPVMIKEARWAGQVLEVSTLEGPRIAQRLFTRTSAKGMTSSGLLVGGG